MVIPKQYSYIVKDRLNQAAALRPSLPFDIFKEKE